MAVKRKEVHRGAEGRKPPRKKAPRKKAPTKKARPKPRAGSAAASAASIVEAVRKKVKDGKKPLEFGTLRESEVMSDVTRWISSGLEGLDEILGGGWAAGRASEVYGDEGCGKSALGHLAIRECQRAGGVAVLLDFEASLDPNICEQLGIDPDTLVHHIPDHMQQGWEIVWAIHAQIKAHPPKHPLLLVWDSVAASVPREELEADVDKSMVGVMARHMSRGCRRMFKAIAEVNMHVMWINQERLKLTFGGPPSPFGPTKETSGGRGPKYAASQRVRCVKTMTLKASPKGGRATGYRIMSITKKNKLAAPEQAMSWVIDFKLGPSPELSIFHELREAGRLKATAGAYSPPWARKRKFKKPEWFELLEDPEFRAGAMESYLAVVRLGGAKQAKAVGSTKKKKAVVEEEA